MANCEEEEIVIKLNRTTKNKGVLITPKISIREGENLNNLVVDVKEDIISQVEDSIRELFDEWTL